MLPPYRVAIVVDRNFGNQVKALSRRLNVWICKTPANQLAVETIWRAQPEYNLESGVTVFNCTEQETPEEMVANILDNVDLHHGQFSHDPAWSIIEVIGCLATEKIKQAFANYQAEVFPTGPDQFEARRLSGSTTL